MPGLLERAAGSGVGVYSAAPYYHQAPRRAELILGYAGLSERELRKGVQGFAEVVAAYEQ